MSAISLSALTAALAMTALAQEQTQVATRRTRVISRAIAEAIPSANVVEPVVICGGATALPCSLKPFRMAAGSMAKWFATVDATLQVPLVNQSCPTCGLRLQRIAELTNARDSVLLTEQVSGVVELPNGHFLATRWDDTLGRVIEFDRAGKARGRYNLGGQMHVRTSVPLVRMGRALLAIDTRSGRIWQVAPPDSVISVHSYPPIVWMNAIVGTFNGMFVTAGALRARFVSGQPLHVYDSSWNRVRSFGLERPQFRADESIYFWRSLTQCGDSSQFWAAHRVQHRLERWSLDGHLLQVVDYVPPWFAPTFNRASTSADRRSHARIVALDCDELGRLWIISLVADKRVTRALPAAKDLDTGRSVERPVAASANLFFDTYIEIIDAERGSVIRAQRLDQALVFHVGPRLFGSFHPATDGGSKILIEKLSFTALPN